MERVTRDRRFPFVDPRSVRPMAEPRVFRFARLAGRIINVVIPIVRIKREFRRVVLFALRLLGARGELHMVALMRVGGRERLMRDIIRAKERGDDD